MTNQSKLILLKLLHTAVWVCYNIVIFYFLYAVIINKIDRWVWICLGLIVLEGLVLLAFKKLCPITIVARKYSDSEKANFDIYLPNWLAKYNKAIYTTIVLIGVLILIYRLFNFMDLDEEKIMKDSRKAFAHEEFQKEPFSKTQYFEEFTKFLIGNDELIINYNQGNESTWKLSNGQYMGFSKKITCFQFITGNEEFIKNFAPPSTVDTINYYLEKLGPGLVTRFNLCTKKDSFSKDNSKGSIKYFLDDQKMEADINSNYYLEHFIYFNRIETPVKEITSIMEYLQKDTTFIGELKYAIRIIPYAGI